MRFCLLTTFYPPYGFGGDAIYVQRLARALVRRGHHVEVIHCVDSFNALNRGTGVGQSRARSARRGLPDGDGGDGVVVHRLRSWAGWLSPLATHLSGQPLFKRRRIAAILEGGRFDVIHYHNISLLGGPAVLAMGRAVKLYTMHEHWLLCATHVLFRFNRALCTRRSCARCQIVHRRPLQLWRATSLLRDSLRHVDAFLALSRFTAQLHQQTFPALPWHHLPPFAAAGETLPQGQPEVPEWLPQGPFALYVGRLERLKGVHTLLPLFAPQDGSTPPLDLVVVGDGSLASVVRQSVRARASRVHWPGALPSSHLPAIYSRATAVIVPSLTYEVFNQVIVEAFACATPVIARDLGPLGEIVSEAGGGLLYRSDAELRQHLHTLQQQPELRNQLGEAGRGAIERIWSEEGVMQRYLAMIEALRQRHSSGLQRVPLQAGSLQAVTP